MSTSKSLGILATGSPFCVVPNFIRPSFLAEVRNDFDVIYADGKFKRAGVGQGSSHGINDIVRRDEVYWLDRTDSTPIQVRLWKRMDFLKRVLNHNLFLGLQDFDGHYANYPKGGFYKRHLDALPERNDRIVSVVLYLNPKWHDTDGGALRIFQGTGHTDIDPVGGTLVCFLSSEAEHEVRPSHAARYTFTGWFRTKSQI